MNWVKAAYKEPALYPGEGIEDNTIYRGEIAEAVSRLSEGYTPGQTAYLYILADVTKIRQTPLAGGPTWASNYYIFTETGEPITSYTCRHSMAPWTMEDPITDEININLGRMPETPIHGYVELWAGGSPDVFLDSKAFTIPVYTGPPPKKEIPWKEIAIGGGILAIIAIIISARR